LADGGTYSTMPLANVASPTRSRCRLEKYARHAASVHAYRILPPYDIERDTSRNTMKLVFVSASNSFT
jgi:hypothetical protein